MILKTEILFEDVQAKELNIRDRMIWGTHFLDMDTVVGFGEFFIDSELVNAVTEINIKGIGSRVFNITLEEFIEVYEEFNNLEKDILNTLKHNQCII